MRIGYGFDVHTFRGIGPIIIGGTLIPYKKGILAHSDGDVLLHALIDSFLGAAALGDIGQLFSNVNPEFKNIDSRVMLRTVWHKLKIQGYSIGNIDITIIAQEPKMTLYIPQMYESILQEISCNIEDINIKSTTTEKAGFIGRREGIACSAVVLLNK